MTPSPRPPPRRPLKQGVIAPLRNSPPPPARLPGRTLIKRMASAMQLNQHNVEMAIKFFRLAVDKRFTQGRSSEPVVASCLYIVCRQEQTSHLLLDFADHLKVRSGRETNVLWRPPSSLCALVLPSPPPSAHLS